MAKSANDMLNVARTLAQITGTTRLIIYLRQRIGSLYGLGINMQHQLI